MGREGIRSDKFVAQNSRARAFTAVTHAGHPAVTQGTIAMEIKGRGHLF